jgi:TetR/AcrR family transcriptional repressor of nem operon
MMRLTKEQAEQNRRLIVKAAARLFRSHGIEGVTVADVMKVAGFTHGGFYNHFASKEELASEAVACAFQEFTANLTDTITRGEDSAAAFLDALKGYLTTGHRDAAGGGCPTAALPIDAARFGEDVQTEFANGIELYLDIFVTWLGGDASSAREEAVTLLSAMVGAIVMSRAVKKGSPALSLELLRGVQNWVVRRVTESPI